MRNNGVYFSVQVFDGDNKISPQMALFYGLSPHETELLQQASEQAKQRLEELHRQHVQLDAASNSEKLIVMVPAFAVEGGKVYDDLLTAFSKVLGEDRKAVFNDISGDQLERRFENFGTARTRYEVALQKTDNGILIYHVARSAVFDAVDYPSGGQVSGSSFSTLDPAGVTKSFPVLKSFPLPTVPTQLPR